MTTVRAQTRYGSHDVAAAAGGVERHVPGTAIRVYRGGSYCDRAVDTRSAFRYGGSPDSRSSTPSTAAGDRRRR